MDALSALLFCCVNQSRYRAKSKHLTSTIHAQEQRTKSPWYSLMGFLRRITPERRPSPCSEAAAVFCTQVNVRKYCEPPIPPNYIRNMFLPCTIQSPINELTPSLRNLATQARKLRTRLQTFNAVHIRRVASAIRSVPDVSKIALSASRRQEDSLLMSSWREQDICDLDWGPHVGVKCERVRICRFFHDGLVIVFPDYCGSKLDGGLEIALSLKKHAMRELERDEFFNGFAKWL